ncbi:hypothetical protein C6500_10830 [Candidatus Poribacteria bacterium]|nr:MAG: hypothetical protein C6500_10830 [Candidatus Poribacteria bacterium]
MKTILVSLSILLCAIALPAFGELTDADLDKIRLIVQEEIEPIKADIVTLKTDVALMKTEVAILKENVNDRFASVNSRIDDVQKNFGRQNNIIIACIGIPMAIIAIGATVWGLLVHRQSRKDQMLERQIEVLTQEIETLKQKQIVRP